MPRSFWTWIPFGSSASRFGAHGLRRVHDLREAVVVVGRLDLQRVEVAERLRRLVITGNSTAAKTRRGAVSGGMRAAYRWSVGAAGNTEFGGRRREARIDPAAVLQIARLVERDAVDQSHPLGQERLPQTEGDDVAPVSASVELPEGRVGIRRPSHRAVIASSVDA